MAVNTKTCSICKQEKLFSDFHKRKSTKDGYNIRCKKCVTLYRKEREKIYEKNRPNLKSKFCLKCNQEKDISSFSEDRKTKNGYQIYCKECSQKANRKWVKKNPLQAKTNYIKWRQKNAKRRAEINLRWAKRNPEILNRNAKKALKRKALYKTHAPKLTTDEEPKQDSKGYMLTKCTYCGKYFYPTVGQVNTRYWGLTHVAAGENRLYCSDNCKTACPVFNQNDWPKGFKPATSREAQPVLRQVVLERDDYTCQICYKSIPDIELHCHHILGYKQNRAYAEDPNNCVSLCKKCHKKVHKLPGCNYKDLRCKEPSVNTEKERAQNEQ